MERWAKRCNKDPKKVTRCSDRTFNFPLTNRKVVAGDMIFVCSLSDFFHPDVPSAWWEEAFEIMQKRTDLIFLLLTKRPEQIPLRFMDYGVCTGRDDSWAKHIWLGVTAENQKRYDERVPTLLDLDWPGKKFVSIEPMLGAIDVDREDVIPYGRLSGIDWIIVGGESGTYCRFMALDWARHVRDQCSDAEVPFFMKQIGGHPDKRAEMADFPKDLRIREFPE
jgi:protein gp37